MRKTKENAAKAIIAAIKDLFEFDAGAAEESVVAGDPWGWSTNGDSAATIVTECGLSCLDYWEASWVENSINIERHVKKNAGLDILIECCNPGVHCVFWN